MHDSLCKNTILLAAAAALLAGGMRNEAFAAEKKRLPLICNRPAFRVIVDVGHTSQEPGARSARGITEYEFNLRLVERIARTLQDAGFMNATVLVTEGPARTGLIQRVSRANVSPPDLFLSIHHDSVPEPLLEEWEFEGVKNRFSDRFSGHSMFVSAENADLKGSLQFGMLLGQQLKTRGLQYTPHYTEAIMGKRQRRLVDADAGIYRFDELWVLRAARTPALLFEAGMIVNRNDELVLASDDRRSLVATAMTDAVEQFCRARANRKPEPVAGTVQAASSRSWPKR